MKQNSKHVLLTLGLFASFSSFSTDFSGVITESGIILLPTIETKVEHVDNVGRLSTSEQPESSTVSIIKPGITLLSERNGNRYELAYQLSSGSFFESKKDNFLDHHLTSFNRVKINRRNVFQLDYSYTSGHEERGTGLLAGDDFSIAANEPVKFALHDIELFHAFGSKGAKGNIESWLDYKNKKHLNYRNLSRKDSVPYGTRYKDFSQIGGGLAFYYRVSQDTQLLAQVNLFDKKYKLDDPENGQSQDSLNVFYYLGAKWDITGKTSGSLHFGLQSKKFDSSSRNDFTGISWNADLDWRPVEYSIISLTGGMGVNDSSQGNTYVERMKLSTQWQHFWVSNLYSQVRVETTLDEYSESDRQDELKKLNLSIGYRETKDADISVGWRYESNDSTLEDNTYYQNVWYVSARLDF